MEIFVLTQNLRTKSVEAHLHNYRFLVYWHKKQSSSTLLSKPTKLTLEEVNDKTRMLLDELHGIKETQEKERDEFEVWKIDMEQVGDGLEHRMSEQESEAQETKKQIQTLTSLVKDLQSLVQSQAQEIKVLKEKLANKK